MKTVTLASIQPLIVPKDDMTVSMFFPTHRYPTSDHIQEDKIRLKNLTRTSKDLLEKQGVHADTIRKIGNRLDELYNNDDFWQTTTEGLAIFASLNDFHCFFLPMECDERASIGAQYELTPLLAFISYDQPYYVLALATHEPRLYRANMYSVEPVDIDLPKSPEKALGIDELFSDSRTVRAGGTYGPGDPSSGSHGQGDSRQAGREERLEFFRLIDEKILKSDTVDCSLPFLIAGSEGEISEYRDLSRHKHLLDTPLHGNYTKAAGVKPQELQSRTWQIVEQERGRLRRSSAVENWKEQRGAQRSSSALAEITDAATNGRVDTLLISMLEHTHDSVRDDNVEVTKLVFPKGYESSGIDVCCRAVHDQGGTILALSQSEMPDDNPVAAIFRY